MAKNALDDKVSNMIFIMKFLDEKGGLELVREYFTEAIPKYLLEFSGSGKAAKAIARQWLKRSPSGYLNMVLNKLREDADFLSQKFENIEDKGHIQVAKVDCKYIRKLVKGGKTYGCDFDIREYYCKNA